ncbi:MAG: phosphatase PAP2 family protein [bacterium]|nr:phosphatase PAP2 family protein [Candidatus Kapabacteria bacterium]
MPIRNYTLAPFVVLLALCTNVELHALGHRIVDADSTSRAIDSIARINNDGSRNDLEQFGYDVGHALTAPARWDSHDLMIAGGVVAGTVGALLLEHEFRDLMLRNQSPFNDALDKVGYTYGAPQYAIPGVLLIYLGGLIADDDWTRQTGLMLISTLAASGVIQIPARIIAGRARPNANLGNADFDPFGGTAQHRASFISGHAAIAFGISTVLARRIDHPIATVLLYSLALTTPYVRMNRDAHWLSDAFFGSVLGVVIGNVIVDGRLESKPIGITVSPSGVGLTYTW